MASIDNAIGSLLTSALLASRLLVPHKRKTRIAALAFLFLLYAASFLLSIATVEGFLSTVYRPEISLALTALATLIVALVTHLVFSILTERKSLSQAKEKVGEGSNITSLFDSAYQEIDGPINSYPKTFLAIVALVGFLVLRKRD